MPASNRRRDPDSGWSRRTSACAAAGRRRRAEVRVVGAGAVLRFRAHGVVAEAAASVVVDLEVAARFIEAVLVLHVVDEVVQVEQVRHRGRTIRARRLRQVEREIEAERRAAARTGIGVRRIVRIDVGVGLHVVALGPW